MNEQIMKHLETLPEGTVVAARTLLHLGTRASVDQALSRLTRKGELCRVGRGRYVRPIKTRFGSRTPAPAKVVESLSELCGETIVPSGAAAANALGLTTQVSVRPVYLTSGRSRVLTLGRQKVELKHAPAWQLREPGRAAGQAVRALAWLGKEHASAAATTLKQTLSQAERRALVATRATLPTWLAKTVSEAFVPAAVGQTHAARA